jgi:hypothetical protein
LLDNNVLAAGQLEEIIAEIRAEGFAAGARRNNRLRTVDFNQGIDARLITPAIASLLASICLSPVRLAFDFDGMEMTYRNAVKLLAQVGFSEFTNYVLFNFKDTPLSLYHRLKVNLELSQELRIRVTGFPMRFVPMDDVHRRYVSEGWRWRYLRGIQCILSATHGLVSPNPEFFAAAFGETFDEFLEIITMPDRYIIHRSHFKDTEAADWSRLYRKLSLSDREEFLAILATLNVLRSEARKTEIAAYGQFKKLLEHYYPNGKAPHM